MTVVHKAWGASLVHAEADGTALWVMVHPPFAPRGIVIVNVYMSANSMVHRDRLNPSGKYAMIKEHIDVYAERGIPVVLMGDWNRPVRRSLALADIPHLVPVPTRQRTTGHEQSQQPWGVHGKLTSLIQSTYKFGMHQRYVASGVLSTDAGIAPIRAIWQVNRVRVLRKHLHMMDTVLGRILHLNKQSACSSRRSTDTMSTSQSAPGVRQPLSVRQGVAWTSV